MLVHGPSKSLEKNDPKTELSDQRGMAHLETLPLWWLRFNEGLLIFVATGEFKYV